FFNKVNRNNTNCWRSTVVIRVGFQTHTYVVLPFLDKVRTSSYLSNISSFSRPRVFLIVLGTLAFNEFLVYRPVSPQRGFSQEVRSRSSQGYCYCAVIRGFNTRNGHSL